MRTQDLIVEPLAAGDVVAFAQCVALDVSSFPFPSIPGLDARPAIWVARAAPGARVDGFVMARRRGALFEIGGIAVAPAQRRRGVGRALLRAAVDGARARRCVAVALQVSTTNRGAIALYVDEGFMRTRRLEGYYRRWAFDEAGDAWLMTLRLA